MNINSIRNRFDRVRVAKVNYVDIFIADEEKISEYFPTAQFTMDGFHKPLRQDASVGLLALLGHTYLYVS